MQDFIRSVSRCVDSSPRTKPHHSLSARDLALVSPADWQKFTAETVEIRKMIYGHRKKVLKNNGSDPHA
jgi:hypothetical protein